MSFQDDFEKHKSESASSDFYKWKEGDNKLRIISEPVTVVTRWGIGICYEGAPYCNKATIEKEYQQKLQEAKANGTDPKTISRSTLSVRYYSWAIDRTTGKFVIIQLGRKLAQFVIDLMNSEEAGFKEWPMPYDVTIKATNAGTTAVQYSVIPSRKEVSLTTAELDEYANKTPMAEIVERMQAKQKQAYESGQITGASQEPMPQHEASQVEVHDEDEINVKDIPF